MDVQMPEDKLMVWGDPDAVTQVCYNLLDNAAKFAASGTAITVQITKKDGKAYTSVRNLGATIPADELPLLFDRFHKADYSRSMDRDGVGLGLYIVKTLLGNLKENITRYQRGRRDPIHLYPHVGLTPPLCLYSPITDGTALSSSPRQIYV